MRVYEATAERDGKFWLVRIPELDGLTQGRSLAEVQVMAKDYIALVTDQPEDSFEVNVTLVLPAAVQAHLKRARDLRAEEARVRAEAAAEARMAARELQSAGLTLQDIGDALEVSKQRAHQLVSP